MAKIGPGFNTNVRSEPPPRSYDEPRQTPADIVSGMPNAEKLTPYERSIYGALPGFSESGIGKALEKFNGTWAGKGLAYLDVFAEGLERTVGLGRQLIDKTVDLDDLKSAWYAGGLTYDLARAPTPVYNSELGKYDRLRIPLDLPGAADGLATARKNIEKYVAQGMTYSDALQKARSDYYDGLGALALRAQLQDTFGHVVLDPLNFAGGFVKKPIDLLQARRVTALQKSLVSADKLTDLASAAKAAGHLEDAAVLTQRAADVASGQAKVVNTLDKVAIFATGGNVFEPAALSKALSKSVLTKGPFLAPESAAAEGVNVVADNVSTMISKFADSPTAVDDAVDAVIRASKASVDQAWGHVAATPMGRGTQALLAGDGAYADALRSEYKAIEAERQILAAFSGALDEAPTKLLRNMADNPEAVLKRLAQSPDPNVQLALQEGRLTSDTLKSLAETIKDMPYNQEMFMAHLMDAVETHAMRNAVTMFGVKERGAVTRWAQAVKAAESMAFMRLNPAYPIRNGVNNELTMMARGVWNAMSDADIDAFWKVEGFTPHRLSESFHIGSDLEKGANVALREALSGKHVGAPEKIQRLFHDISIGKLDMGALARGMERSASRRAMTAGYQQFMHDFWKPDRIQNLVDSATLDAINAADPQVANLLDKALKASGANAKKLDDIVGGNLNTTFDAVLDDAEAVVGHKLSESLGTDAVAYLRSGLQDAIKNNKVEGFMFDLKRKIDRHVDDLFNQTAIDLTEQVKNQTIAGGPQVWHDQLGRASMMWLDGEIEHAIKISPAADAAAAAKNAGDFKKANNLWRVILADDERHFARYETRMNSVLDGMEQGWKALKEQASASGKAFDLPNIAEVRKTFTETRKAYRDFFSFRNKSLEDFFAAKLEGKQYRLEWDALQGELNVRYQKVAGIEDGLAKQADASVVSMIRDPQIKAAVQVYRKQISDLRLQLRTDVVEFRKVLDDLPAEERQLEWARFWNDRQAKLGEIRMAEQGNIAAMQGDPRAVKLTEASAYANIPTSPEGAPPEISSRINKITDGSQTTWQVDGEGLPFTSYAQAAAEAMAKNVGATAEIVGPAISQSFVADVKKVVPDIMPLDLITEQANYGRVQPALDAILDAAKRQSRKPPAVLANLSPELQGKVTQALSRAKDKFGDAKLMATQFAEFRRDSALLNYNRRTNFDNWLSNMFPYLFWTTGSMQMWAIETINRPAMLTNYLRMKKLLETAGTQQDGLPSRLQDHVRIKLPFAPEWMGDQFVDPLRFVMPFESFAQPIEQMQKNGYTVQGRAERLLETQLQEGSITQDEFNEAISHEGSAWENAVSQAQTNDESLKFDAWDFASLVSSPHAPIVWAYNAAKGTPEDIGPFAPLSRMTRNAMTTFGVDDWNNHPYNLEAKFRRSIGLPAFDKWDDYRIDRSISNLATTNKYTLEEINDAMRFSSMVQAGQISPDEAKARSEVYAEGVKRANQEYSGGLGGSILGLLGINTKAYPEGEENLRQLGDDFGRAYEKYKAADAAVDRFLAKNPNMSQEDALDAFAKRYPTIAKDAEALTDFFDAHPEYEVRLALFDKPEERLRRFLVDDFWGKYMGLPKVTKDELRDQLGSEFNSFINKETRSYDAVTSPQMALWLKFMGGKQVGILTADQELLGDLFSGQLQFTKPETAWRAQSYYDTRSRQFPDYYEQQNAYYAPGANKRKVLQQYPELKDYWDWRRDFMAKNPDIVPYITDDPKAIEKAKKAQRNPSVAVPTVQELNLSGSAQTLLQGYRNTGDLPDELRQYLEVVAESRGLSIEQVYGMLGVE